METQAIAPRLHLLSIAVDIDADLTEGIEDDAHEHIHALATGIIKPYLHRDVLPEITQAHHLTQGLPDPALVLGVVKNQLPIFGNLEDRLARDQLERFLVTQAFFIEFKLGQRIIVGLYPDRIDIGNEGLISDRFDADLKISDILP